MTKITKDLGHRDLDKNPLVLSDGTVLTEELATQWDREAEQRLARGRPALDRSAGAAAGASARSPQVSARVPRALLLKLQARAKAEGKPTSEVVRDALWAHVG